MQFNINNHIGLASPNRASTRPPTNFSLANPRSDSVWRNPSFSSVQTGFLTQPAQNFNMGLIGGGGFGSLFPGDGGFANLGSVTTGAQFGQGMGHGFGHGGFGIGGFGQFGGQGIQFNLSQFQGGSTGGLGQGFNFNSVGSPIGQGLQFSPSHLLGGAMTGLAGGLQNMGPFGNMGFFGFAGGMGNGGMQVLGNLGGLQFNPNNLMGSLNGQGFGFAGLGSFGSQGVNQGVHQGLHFDPRQILSQFSGQNLGRLPGLGNLGGVTNQQNAGPKHIVPIPPKPPIQQPPPKPPVQQPIQQPPPKPPVQQPIQQPPPSHPVLPPSDPILPPPSVEPGPTVGALTKQQVESLQLLARVAQRGAPTAQEKKQILEIYRGFRPDVDIVSEIANISRQTAIEAFNIQRETTMAAAANWNSFGTQEREQVLRGFTNMMNSLLGTDVAIEFFHTPPDENNRVRHGYYSPGTNTIHLNTHNSSTGSFAVGLKTVFHEMIHAYYFLMTKHLSAEQVIKKAISGELTFTDALAYFNLREGQYFAASDVGQRDYELNPHEQLAFIGQHFWEKEARARGLSDSHTTFGNDHPLAIFVRDSGFA